jgi:lactate dehydrogenase-like 2-hydroxyacid dehydrogenase
MKPLVVTVGDKIKNSYVEQFKKKFELVEAFDISREDFIANCKGPWKGMVGMMRNIQPSSRIGAIDNEFIESLPSTCKIATSTGAGYNNVDIDTFTKRRMYYSNTFVVDPIFVYRLGEV